MKLTNAILHSLLAIGASLLSYGGETTATATASTDAAITGSAAIGYNSIYEFRGVDLGSNMVESSASLTATYEGFGYTASAWYATVNDSPKNTTSNELDLTFAITKSLGPVNLSGGYIFYNFYSANATNTQELYLGASTEITAGISASATAYYDIDLWNGWFFDLNLSKTFKPSDSVDIVTTVGVGLAESTALQAKANGAPLDGYQDFYAMISVPWTVRKNVVLAPYVRYVSAASDLVSDSTSRSTGQEHFIGGLKLTVSF
ncbi:MAG: TorF family putative porin [Verrucomicrobiota bacterium]